jgi:hypothetical protein
MKTKLLILLMIFFCSCGRKVDQKNNGTIKVIDLTSEPESEITKVSDIATNLDYIPLQTTENSLIKFVNEVIKYDDKIYVRSSSELLCFDIRGKFLYKLSRAGRGPGEYLSIFDFDVSSDNQTLIVLGYVEKKISVFNNTGNEFIFKKSINLNPLFPSNNMVSKVSFVPESPNILLSVDPNTGTEEALSIVINIDGDSLYFKPNHYMIEKGIIPNSYISNMSLHFKFENNIYFKECFSDTAFFVDKETNNFKPGLIFDSNGLGVSPKIRYDREYARSHYADSYWVNYVIETPRYIIYTYEHNREYNKMIYDKSVKKKFKIAFKDALEDDINGGPVFDPNFCSENIIYSYVDALTLKKYVASEEFIKAKVKDSKKKEALKKLADSLKETDNPVLIVVTPKD